MDTYISMCVYMYTQHLYVVLTGVFACCHVLLQASCLSSSGFLVFPGSLSGCTLSDSQSPISSLETKRSLHTSASLWREILSYLKRKEQRRKFVNELPILCQEKTRNCLCDPSLTQEHLHFQIQGLRKTH